MNKYKFKIKQSTPANDQPHDHRVESECCCPICDAPCDINDIDDLLTNLFEMFEELHENRTDQSGKNRIDETDLIEAIEDYAIAAAYGEQFLVWIPINELDLFLSPLFDEYLQEHDLEAVLDRDTAMLDMTQFCYWNNLDMSRIYCNADL